MAWDKYWDVVAGYNTVYDFMYRRPTLYPAVS